MPQRLRLVLTSLALAVVVVWATPAAAQPESVLLSESSTLTVDVVPLDAEVLLDGVPIGSAHDLVARAIAVVPGGHILEINAPGYLTTTMRVSADVDWATRIWLQLVPDRSKPPRPS